MAGFILVIDDNGRVKEVAEAAVRGADVRVLGAADFVSAKRMLVQAAPNLVLSCLSVGGDPEGGYSFCRQLQGHSELSQVPVILVSDSLDEDGIRRAAECGAKGMVAWPVTVTALRNRMAPILPELETIMERESASVTAKEAVKPPKPELFSDTEKKLQAVQRLLAQVLHNLKTSDLLEIVELEDIPRIVSEMTRSVCGEAEAAASQKPAQESEKRTELDLEKAFQLKK